MQESGNDKYIDGIWDLTVPREGGLAKNWERDAGFRFACRSGIPETVTANLFKRPRQINHASAQWCDSFQTKHPIGNLVLMVNTYFFFVYNYTY